MENWRKTPEPLLREENGYFQRLCRGGGEVSFTMSGRCGIYQCLEDIKRRDQKRVAYLPMYTCETVAAPFHKAGYAIRFYEVDRGLRSIFDQAVIGDISVLSLCGYYGFLDYDRGFVQACHDRGVVIFEDLTHSLLSDGGLDPLCDYAAGSFRKWLEIPSGGFAVKFGGVFSTACRQPHQEHLALRRQYLETHSMEAFWGAERMLRQIFDLYGSDEESEYILRHADFEEIKERRRDNYRTLLEALPERLRGLRPVFPALPEGTVPSHFCLYADNREHFLAYLQENGVPYKVFWPVGPLVDLTGHPTVQWIYEHIMALFCDQHQTGEDMLRLAGILAGYPGPTI